MAYSGHVDGSSEQSHKSVIVKANLENYEMTLFKCILYIFPGWR
jgi:hypothetical protein